MTETLKETLQKLHDICKSNHTCKTCPLNSEVSTCFAGMPPVAWTDKEFDKIIAAIQALEQEPTTKNNLGVDAVSREAVLDLIADYDLSMGQVVKGIHALPSVTPQELKTGHCKDCKWWKDSDGAFRRGIGAESQCPMNRIEVFDGSGYCYLFEPQKSEDKENNNE